MPQLNLPPTGVKLGEFAPAVLALGTLECAFDGDDIVTPFILLHLDHFDIGYVQRQ